MAIHLVVPGAGQLRLIWDFGGQGGVNVLGLVIQGSVTFDLALANRLGSAIKPQFTANLAPHMPASTRLMAIGVRDIRNPNLAEYIDTGAPVPGTGTGDPLPRSVALCATIRTLKAGRSFRGRYYQGGFAESENNASGAFAQVLADAVTSFLTQVNGATTGEGMPVGVISRPSLAKTISITVTNPDGTTSSKTKSYPARTGVVTPSSAFQVRDLVWDSQRRRNNGKMPTGALLALAQSTSLVNQHLVLT